jgi:hypothetical protein
MKAWKSVLVSVTSYAFGLFMISKAPWYLLPFAWAWTGTAVTGVSSVHILSLLIHNLVSFASMLQVSSVSYFCFSLNEVFCFRP